MFMRRVSLIAKWLITAYLLFSCHHHRLIHDEDARSDVILSHIHTRRAGFALNCPCVSPLCSVPSLQDEERQCGLKRSSQGSCTSQIYSEPESSQR